MDLYILVSINKNVFFVLTFRSHTHNSSPLRNHATYSIIFSVDVFEHLSKFHYLTVYKHIRTVESLSRPLRKFAVVADLEVPVSPTSTTGLFMLTMSSSSHVVLTVSTVGTKISENFFSGS